MKLVDNCLIHNKLQKILGANGAEDYKENIDNQRVGRQLTR